MMYGQGMMNGMSAMTPMMWLYMILLWGFAIFSLVWAVKWLTSRGRSGPKNEQSADGILANRYARGEITLGEFKKMKRDLK